MRSSLWLSTLLIAGLGGTSLFAQGGDECTTATVISGQGPHAFDQTAATAGLDTSVCGTINFDVWFAWTATQSADHIFTTCGGASHDTKIAVYDSCGGAEIACNDDACGLQSSLTFAATAGTTYYLRVGTYGTVPGSTGTFEVIPDLPIVNPNNGHAYKIYDGYTDWLSAKAAAEASMYAGNAGHLVTITDQAELDWLLNNLNVSRPWIGLYQDVNDPNFSEPGGGWKWVTGEAFSFSNWAVGEPNNTSGSGGAEDYAEMFASGEWNDAELNHLQTNSYLVEWDGGQVGTSFCDPANNNSTGVPTHLSASNSAAAPSGLHLEATNGPTNQFGYFLVGTASSDPGIVVSQGRLCLSVSGGNVFGRYNVPGALNSVGLFDASGVLQNAVGTSTVGSGYDVPLTVPVTGSPQIMTGQTWHFQLWHREAAGASNFSNGVSVTF
ncbi:MAG: hypothetical protein H6830_09745 [Planctomycetes bacterium]|nr:hypothetical protein [Planctomycetota bacterium]MCB9910008.1 hypothetical protein [Planctomycetota bacterium]